MRRVLRPTARVDAKRHRLRDELTSVATRSLLIDRVRQAVSAQARHGGVVAVLFVDIEDFRALSDDRGPTIADQLLIAIAERLELRLRATDTLARTAGDEFGILLDCLVDADGALDAAQRIVAAMAEPFPVPGALIAVTAKVGLTLSIGGLSADDLVRQAGAALAEAHAVTGPQFVVYEARRYAAALRLLAVKSELVGALTREEISVHYQPIIDLVTDQVVAVEALARWRRPDGTPCPPDVFIPVAERNSRVAEIDHFVLRQGCRDAASWRSLLGDSAPGVAVNLSARSLQNPDLVPLVEAALEDANLPARYLTVEVTERSLIAEGALVGRNLAGLKARGASVALDDFGTGHSSLSHLDTFPVDQLKIDRSFIDRVAAPSGDRVARAILTLAAALGLEVVAEGIERHEQREALTGLGCILGQGFLFAPPLAHAEMTALLGNGDPLCAQQRQDAAEVATHR